MNFLIDAQLPKTLADFLRSRGFDAIHTSELPDGNKTEDEETNKISLTKCNRSEGENHLNQFLLSEQRKRSVEK